MLERYDPFGRPYSLRQMMDRLLEDAFVAPRQGQAQGAEALGNLALNAYEEGGNLVVEAHVPGMRPEDIDVSVNQGVLTIRGQTRQEEERKERNYVLREYRAGSFSRSVRLPENVNPDACEASYDQGVLRLRFPEAEERKPRRIDVRSGAGGQRQLGGQGKQAEGTQGEASRPQESSPKQS